jgi:hypothetical protein
MPGHIALASARMECLEGRIGMAGTDQSPSTEKSARKYTLGIRLYLYASPPSANGTDFRRQVCAHGCVVAGVLLSEAL